MTTNNSKSYKVKISVGDTIVEIEGDADGVTQIVDRLKSVLENKVTKPNVPTTYQENSAFSSDISRAQDIRAFFKERNPRNHREAAATVAYFLQYLEGSEKKRDVLNTDTLMDEFRKADWELPKAAAQVLVDAKQAGYFDPAGVGLYRLNSVGYNLVKHALGSAGSQEITPKTKKKRRKK